MKYGYLLGIAESLPGALEDTADGHGHHGSGYGWLWGLFWPVGAEAGAQCGARLAQAGLDGAGRYAQVGGRLGLDEAGQVVGLGGLALAGEER